MWGKREVFEGKKIPGLENNAGEDGYLQAYTLTIKENVMKGFIVWFL